jgi:hypothetical protein
MTAGLPHAVSPAHGCDAEKAPLRVVVSNLATTNALCRQVIRRAEVSQEPLLRRGAARPWDPTPKTSSPLSYRPTETRWRHTHAG